MNIILGLTGSVAATLAPKLVQRLLKLGNVAVVTTERAKEFYRPLELQAMAMGLPNLTYYDDATEWLLWKRKGDPVQHIDLRKWGHVLVIAPLTANTLAKMANGIADNLLTSIVRAWDYNKPMILAPAMNTLMMEHPLTERQLQAVRDFDWQSDSGNKNVVVVNPVEKVLACGDEGTGAMASIEDVVLGIENATRWQWPLFRANGLPFGNHPGAFGFRRKHDVHTGVDLYTGKNSAVFAMETGKVVKVIPFTGAQFGYPWWENTSAVLVEGPSGVICYGEVEPHDSIKKGESVRKGQAIARVTPVLPEGKERLDIPGHSRSMLHIELYTHLYEDKSRGIWEGWDLNAPNKPERLLDPTKKLLAARPMHVPLLILP